MGSVEYTPPSFEDSLFKNETVTTGQIPLDCPREKGEVLRLLESELYDQTRITNITGALESLLYFNPETELYE